MRQVSLGLKLDTISHAFDDHLVVDRLSLSVAPGELVCLLGPSGCGKTTTLRIAAGLEAVQQGQVIMDGEVVAGQGGSVPPERRGIGFLFQDFALFPHLTVAGNVAFGLRRRSQAHQDERVREVLAQVGMQDYAGAFPHMLSGGQQQRVALARALAPGPRLMLLDEPFSGLDTTLRAQVRDQTLHVLKASGVSTLMVTHDPEEAMFMADRIVLMRDGRIEQAGPPTELYRRPTSAFVAAFFGEINRLRGEVRADGRVDTPFGRIPADGLAPGSAADVLIRPEGLRLMRLGHGGGGDHPVADTTAKVIAARLLGRSSLIHIGVEAGEETVHLHSRMPGDYLPPENEPVMVRLDLEQVFVFAASDHQDRQRVE